MEKKYGYTYNNSSLAARNPMTAAQMQAHLAATANYVDSNKYKIFELVPVKIVTTTAFERIGE